MFVPGRKTTEKLSSRTFANIYSDSCKMPIQVGLTLDTYRLLLHTESCIMIDLSPHTYHDAWWLPCNRLSYDGSWHTGLGILTCGNCMLAIPQRALGRPSSFLTTGMEHKIRSHTYRWGWPLCDRVLGVRPYPSPMGQRRPGEGVSIRSVSSIPIFIF